MEYKEGKAGGFDPHARMPDMDADGIDAAFLFPTLGLFSGAIHEPELAAATCRAYNRWLADYCSAYPDRLFGIAMLPLQIGRPGDRRDALRAERSWASSAGFIRPNPYHGSKMVSDPMYEPFWAAAEDLDFAIAFHEGAGGGMPQVGIDRFEGRGARHIITHTMEMMLACLAVIWGGVVREAPEIAHRLHGVGRRLDRPLARPHGPPFRRPGLQRFRADDAAERSVPAQLLDLVRAGRGLLNVLADYVGPHKIMWATDYPHPDGFFPGAPDMVRNQLAGLSEETKRQVMGGGAKAFYGLN